MKTIDSNLNVIIKSDKVLFVIISIMFSIIPCALGVWLCLYAPKALLVISYFCFFLALLPIVTWKKYYYRQVILYNDKVSIFYNNKVETLSKEDVKAITVGVHTIIYMANNKRYVIRYSAITQDDIFKINPTWYCFKYNGDLRFRQYLRIASAVILCLFLFNFATKSGIEYSLIIIAIIAGIFFTIWLINYLFLE